MSTQQNLEIKELLFIQTKCVAVTIKGTAVHPLFSGVEYYDKESELLLACDDSCETCIYGDYELQYEQNLGRAYISEYSICPMFFEQQQYEILIEPEKGHTVEFWHENYNIRKKVTPVGHKSYIWSGMINFGNEIGLSDLVILVDGKPYLKITIEVFPSKITYKEDYKAIVADVTAEVYNLTFDFLKKTYSLFHPSMYKQSSSVEFFEIIKRIFKEFMIAIDMIFSQPHHILKTEREIMPGHKIKRIDNRTMKWIEKHPGQAKMHNNEIYVSKALTVRKYVTFDTRENRLTKYILLSTVKRLENFKTQYLKLGRDIDEEVLREINGMIHKIKSKYMSGFMKEISAQPNNCGMSLVFGMSPGYKDLYRCYLLLQHGLSVTGNLFHVSVKDLAVLYEYWCFIKLNRLMKEKYQLISQDIIKVKGNGLFVSLLKGQRSQVRYLNPETGEMITLSYNPKEIHVPTVAQRPDNVLRLEKKGSEIDYEYIFDAKYRINGALEGSTYQLNYGTPGPQEDDINTMHRYRDAIVYQNNASPYERTMFGAYVLFPYHNEKEYENHHFYKSIDRVNIGGLPFLPSATELVSKILDELISDSPASAFERTTLPIGIEKKLRKVDWKKRDVLIGTFRSRSQFEICLKNNFYYIPATRISNNELPIHYVAMFQTPRIFTNEAGIYFYGEVLRTALVKRETIKEVPMTHGNPDDLYYRFIVREWIPLQKSILPKESAFVHQFTNLFLLKHAEYVQELLLRSEEEFRFYYELKRRTNEAIMSEDDAVAGFEMNGYKVLFQSGQIHLIYEGQIVDQCSIQEFSRKPNATFRRFQNQTLLH